MTSLLHLTTSSAAQQWADSRRQEGKSIALVPTMGALHAGHVALMERAAELCDLTVVSIFVNPTQFDRSDDFDSYPRTLEEDLNLCESAGVTAVFVPTASAMYPAGFDTSIDPGSLAQRWEGEHRSGHFAGVATVVVKLLTAVQPHVALFGEKDFQQLAIIKHVVRDLGMPVDIVGVPTVREDDGLALSSRNVHLSPSARSNATAIKRGIDEGIKLSATSPMASRIVEHVTTIIAESDGTVEYVAVVNPETLEPVYRVEHDAQILVAAWFGGVRLIDNARIQVSP